MESDPPDYGRDRLFGDFDWSKNLAWLRSKHMAGRLGIDGEAALASLAVLYPPHVCEEMARDQVSMRRILPLFIRQRDWDANALLLLGSDLSCCDGWRTDSQLVGGLRHGTSWEPYRTEAGVWAALTRAGLRVSRGAGGNGGAQPDFHVIDGQQSITIEVKHLHPAPRDFNRNWLESLLSRCYMVPRFLDQVSGRLVVFELAGSLASAALTIPSETLVPTIEGKLLAALRHWAANVDLEPGATGEIPCLGSYRVERTDSPHSGGLDLRGLECSNPDSNADRLIRTVRAAARQLNNRPSSHRVAAVFVDGDNSPLKGAEDTLVSRLETVLQNPGAPDVVTIHEIGSPDWRPSPLLAVTRDPAVATENSTWHQGLSLWQQGSI